MAKDQTFSVKEAVHKLQLFLLDGIHHENQLFAAGSLMSPSDYKDVVTERSISKLCGYPLCNNHLPSERPGKGRYRISLKEHKVYDLQETYMYCSSGCLINSRAFAGSLQPERCSVLNPAKINEVLSLFGDASFNELVYGKKGDLGLSDLKIQEIEDTKAVGELSMENWVGPSNAIEGYVPKDHSLNFKYSRLKQHDEEACASALSQAAEAVASCESDVSNAVMEAGITILSHAQDDDEENYEENVHELELMRLAQKPGFADFESHDTMYRDSWYDTVPEGFNLGLSSFATMFMALFGWITSSSLAYIYGRDESSCEEFSVVNGREYPCKRVLSDGRSSEIKQTLASCLAQTLPSLVMDLRLPTPVSALEQGLGHLLDTMSFLDALPPFRTKQWNVIILVFIDALSVSRFPALTPYMTSRRMLLHKVLDGAGVSVQEYETMKDIVMPLGRLPQFSTQSGA